MKKLGFFGLLVQNEMLMSYIVRNLLSEILFWGGVEQLHVMILVFLTILGDFGIRYPPLSNTSYRMPRHKHCLLPAALKAIKEGRKIPLLLLFLLLWPIFIVARFFFFFFFFLLLLLSRVDSKSHEGKRLEAEVCERFGKCSCCTVWLLVK